MLDQWLGGLLTECSEAELAQAYHQLSQRYHQPNYTPGFQNELEVKAYAAARMPATFAAISRTFLELPENFLPTSILDLGAGTGAGSLAALQHFPSISSVQLVEQDPYALSAAKQLIKSARPGENFEFQQQNLKNFSYDQPHDLILLSYVLNEFSLPEQKILLQNVLASQSSFILILMPGTPSCFRQLLQLRQLALDSGYFIVAPCPHHQVCPMATTPSDWCHFAVRLARTRVHRLSKAADLNFEDEKFCYLLLSKDPVTRAASRIVKKPIHRSGHSIFDICVAGELKRVVIGRKHKSFYKAATKLSWGDTLEKEH